MPKLPSPVNVLVAVPDEPLPFTLRFVFTLGGLFLVGWFLMFWLLQSRW
ncbi:MAG: hypothetical protein IAI50_07405 [Candidatus Eremiobacteraeota bacterium]|nr:hypothetical protein [Candidatus Eremiobacteraeota bacterium]